MFVAAALPGGVRGGEERAKVQVGRDLFMVTERFAVVERERATQRRRAGGGTVADFCDCILRTLKAGTDLNASRGRGTLK